MGIIKHLSITLFSILFSLILPSLSQAQRVPITDANQDPIVRLIYFRPNDRPFRQEVVNAMTAVIRYAQTFYAEQMQAHGYENKAFRFETDAKGKPKVHRVVGQYPGSHYGFSGGQISPANEFSHLLSKIYFIVYDLNNVPVYGGRSGKNDGSAQYSTELILAASKSASRSLYAGEHDFYAVVHELGHAFGLNHDWRDGAYIMSYGPAGWNRLSACAAEFLAVHPYFNSDIPLKDGSPPTIELVSQRTYPAGAISVPVRLRVNDSDGLHQVNLNAHAGLKACQRLNGEKDAIVEFDYDGVISPATDPNRIGTSLSNPATHPIGIEVVDVYGNVSWLEFELAKISSHLIATFEGPTNNGVKSLVFSPDGKKVASSGGGTILWDVATQRNIATFNESVVAFSPNGRILATGTSNIVKLWDIVTQRNTAIFEGHAHGGYPLVFSPGGKMLASGSGDGTITLWDIATNEITTFEGHTAPVNSVAFSPDRKKIASGADYGDGTIKLWDIATRTNTATFEVSAGWPIIYSVAFSPDGATLAAGHGNGRGGVRLWDIKTGHEVASLGKGSYDAQIFDVRSIAFSPDGEILASAGSRDGTVKLWDLATRTHIGTFSHTSGVWSVALSPDGSTLASGTEDGVVNLWNLPPRTLVSESQRPPMYWVDADAGTLHRLVGATVENLLPSVQNATSLIVDATAGKLYWTEKTSDYTGKIRAANLDGSNPQLVKDLINAPLHLTLDTVGSKLYLISSWGQLQRMNVDGSNFQTNLIIGILAPKGLAVDSIGGKVYWIEQTGERTGTIRRANLDGTAVALVKDLTAVPQGIAIDALNGKLYITNGWGKVQRMNLDGSQYESNLITGLKSPMDLAVDSAGGKVYWMEEGHLRRADLNGENVEDVVIGFNSVAGLILGIEVAFGDDELMISEEPIDAGPKIEGPWIWVIAPTGRSGGAVAAASGRDFLSEMSNGIVTEMKIATNGATEGAPVGDSVWTLHKLASTGNNINNMVNAAGLGSGDIDLHVAYGSITLDSPRQQQTEMFVGSDDAVKVWLNGELVHDNPVDRPAYDFQDQFPVTLKAGTNILLVAVYERYGYWRGFFGFAADAEYYTFTPNVTVSFSPATLQSPAIGEQLTLSLKIANGENVAGYQATVQFDDTALRYVSGANGDYLPAGAHFVGPVVDRNLVTFAAASLAGESNGGGTLTTFTFAVIAVKPSTLTLSDVVLSNQAAEGFVPKIENAQITEPSSPWDVNEDGITDATDVILVTAALGQQQPKDPRLDVNGDGVVDAKDLALVVEHLGEGDAPAGPSHPALLLGFTLERVEHTHSLLHAADDGTLTFKRGIANLKRLLLLFVPEETALLHNYPNPFNPETWIPYQLSKSASVTLTIYDIQGHVVRALDLGHQRAGIYKTRSRAAYWDGRNAVGESVASGLYFYTLTAGDFTVTRKMLIRK